jgi:hypothetical protein
MKYDVTKNKKEEEKLYYFSFHYVTLRHKDNKISIEK